MLIYNTLSGKKEDLDKILGGKKKINMFVCGPTVYDEPHLGHARVAIFFDFTKRYLQSLGYKVKYVQNITDVDDKIIYRAEEEKTDWKTIARKYEKEYLRGMKSLGVKSVDKYPRASGHIKAIIKQIKILEEKGFAYKTSSGVYFEVKKFSEYGKLSKQNLDELRSGWRIEPDPEKRDPMDFALWKLKKHAYEPSWQSPWGGGRPGWHIEDTAITEKYFGPQYDLHGGGMDLKFPHHESEIAQQEAASGKKPFVKLWTHVGFLMVNGEKMSKSLKNFITVGDFLKTRAPEILSFIFLQHHYRSPIDYTEKTAEQAYSALESLSQFLEKLKLAGGNKDVTEKITESENNFNEALDDDFNTPEALATIFRLINELQQEMWSLSKRSAKNAAKWIVRKLNLLGSRPQIPKIPLKIKLLARKRELSRHSKQFTKSDALRKEIETLGYTIEDTPNGPFLWRIRKS
ncbi:MAG: cysteine--tRNA ligase [Patescibacteria group bacterium]